MSASSRSFKRRSIPCWVYEMVERSSRLDLIERAARRLGTVESTVAALPPVREDGLAANLDPAPAAEIPALSLPVGENRRPEPVVAPTLVKEEIAPPPPEPSVSSSANVRSDPGQRTCRIKFNEVRRRGMITPDNLRSNISFEFRAIKRKLLASARDQRSNALSGNLIMVTSALPGEGKTFTATNLAFALTAERDLQVLLIDADVIRPSIGALFDNREGPGLTDLLNGKYSDFDDVTCRCEDIDNLGVIFAGARDEHTPELISSQRTAELLRDVSKKYEDRIVVFDTPPALASAETANLAGYMHQVILVVAWGEANRHQIQKALDNVSACRNVSLVFNKSPKWQKMNSDYYYYYTEDKNVPKP